MIEKRNETGLAEMLTAAVDGLDVAVTIIDTRGFLLYYNDEASKILDRKAEYIGTDAHLHHKKAASNEKFDSMLESFKAGRREPYHYDARPYGKLLRVTLAPIIQEGEYVGCVQTVRLKEPA